MGNGINDIGGWLCLQLARRYKETGDGDCFNFWLPVSPVTTTSDSFTSDSVIGLCLIESGTSCPLADEHRLISNIVFNIVLIVFDLP